VKVGISSWTYGWAVGVPGYPPPARPLDAFGLLARTQALDVEVLQIADNLPVDRLPQAEAVRLGAEAGRLGLVLELGTRGVDAAHLARYLELALCVGARLVRTLMSAAMPVDGAIEAIRRALPAYERAGVTLAIENYEAHSTADLARLVASIGSANFGVCLDSVNSFGALETPADVIRRLARHAVNVHIKDFDIVRVPSTLGYVIEGRPAGQGRLGIAWLLEEVCRSGRNPNIILEQWTPFRGGLEETIALEASWAEQSVQYLRGVLARPLPAAVASQA